MAMKRHTHPAMRAPLYHAPDSVLDHLTGWDAPLHVHPDSQAATWLSACDLEPKGGGFLLASGLTPPRLQGPALRVDGASVHDVGDGVLLSVPHPDTPHQARWWPVVLTPKADPVVVDGYTLTWKDTHLWVGEEGLTITDTEGGDVPPSIFARRKGTDALAHAFTARMHALEHGLARFAQNPPPVPTVTERFEAEDARTHVWEPWRPHHRVFFPTPQLEETMARMGALLSPATAREGGLMSLRGGHPQQNGHLSPLQLTLLYPAGHDLTPAVPKAVLAHTVDVLRAQGLLGTLDREPWVSSRHKPMGIAVEIPERLSSAHHRMREQAWAQSLGWNTAASL